MNDELRLEKFELDSPHNCVEKVQLRNVDFILIQKLAQVDKCHTEEIISFNHGPEVAKEKKGNADIRKCNSTQQDIV